MNYVYILRCADDTLYCGWTTDLSKRLVAHNSGRGAKYREQPDLIDTNREFGVRYENGIACH